MATVIAAAGGSRARIRRHIISHFLSADAISPDKAVPYDPPGFRHARMFRHIQDRDVIREASVGRYYLDAPSYEEWTRARRRRIKGVLGAVGLAGLAVALLG